MNWRPPIAQAPLVPVAICATAGIALDRWANVPVAAMAALVAIGAAIWLLVPRYWIVGVGLLFTGFFGLHHHLHHHSFANDEIGRFVADDSDRADAERRLVRIIGRVCDDPVIDRPQAHDPLRSVQGMARTHFVLEAKTLFTDDGERTVSGLVSVSAEGAATILHAGQPVEVVGWLAAPPPAMNPGERDQRSLLLDRRIRATLVVRGNPAAITAVPGDGSWSIRSALSTARAWAKEQLTGTLPAPLDGVAGALLLGDMNAMSRSDLEPYMRTGVIHVLAISGLHLAVLAWFISITLSSLFVSKRITAATIIVALVLYTALVGGRPPVMRATVMVTVFCGAIIVGRTARPANSLALAWLIVLAMNPASIADPGCQFSFFCVAILIWGCTRWLERGHADPLQKLIDEARPWHRRLLRNACMAVLALYALNLILGIAVLPLTAAHFHMIPVTGLLIGPPMVVLSSVALVAGFVQLLAALVSHGLASFVAFFTKAALAGMTACVQLGDHLPGSHVYVGAIPAWWMVGFLTLVAAMLWLPVLVRRPIGALVAILIWFCAGLCATLYRPAPDGLVVTFLAVGHGGCTVIETPDKRVLLFDAGSMSGPEVTRNVIAPFLWHRGITAIDEVFISHADLDHFNGLPALMDRLAIGRVSLTPSFAAKPTPGVHEVIDSFRRAGIPTRIVLAGDKLNAGEVALDVLHPPPEGPPGPENFRSMVLAVRHLGKTIVLTGDLDGEGRAQVFQRGRELADVLMAPHHGGKTANPPEIADWFRPEVVVACQSVADRTENVHKMYDSAGCRYVGTWPHGAVTFSNRRDGLWCETFRTRLQWKLPSSVLAGRP